MQEYVDGMKVSLLRDELSRFQLFKYLRAGRGHQDDPAEMAVELRFKSENSKDHSMHKLQDVWSKFESPKPITDFRLREYKDRPDALRISLVIFPEGFEGNFEICKLLEDRVLEALADQDYKAALPTLFESRGINL